MFEVLALLLGVGLLVGLLSLVGAVFQLAVSLILLPFKLLGGILHGLFGLVGGVLMLVLVGPLLLALLPLGLVLALLALPVMAIGWLVRPCPF